VREYVGEYSGVVGCRGSGDAPDILGACLGRSPWGAQIDARTSVLLVFILVGFVLMRIDVLFKYEVLFCVLVKWDDYGLVL
jgi:hypothetical protein